MSARRFGLRLFVAQGSAALLAFGFATLMAERLLVLDARASAEASRTYWLGFVVHIVVLAFGVARAARRSAQTLADPSQASPSDVYLLYRTSLHLAGTALLASVLAALAMASAPVGSAPLLVRALIALLGFNALVGLHLGGYVWLRQIVGAAMTSAPPSVAGQASRLRVMAEARMGTIAVRVALGVALAVYFVAQGALLQTGARLRAELEAGREEIAHDVETVLAMSTPEVRAKVGAAARARGFGAPSTTATLGDDKSLPAPLVGHNDLTIVGVFSSLILCLLALGAGGLLGRSYAGALQRVAREIRGMGDDAQGVSAELFDTTRYRDVTELLFAVGELGYLFQRFAIAKSTAAASNIRTERMRAQFLTSMSHDLKAPMNAVLGFAELLSRHSLSPGQHESVTIIKQRGEELMLLIQTVLDSARLEAESFVLSPESVALEGLVQEALTRNEDLGNEIEILTDFQDTHEVLVDGERMRFAILLLLRTALRLTSPGHAVYVHVVGLRVQGQVELVIESSGGALSPAEVSRVFESFHYTADARKLGSLGLGLSLAQSIVALSRGAVEVSAAESGAVRMVVRLPMQRDTDPSLLE